MRIFMVQDLQVHQLLIRFNADLRWRHQHILVKGNAGHQVDPEVKLQVLLGDVPSVCDLSAMNVDRGRKCDRDVQKEQAVNSPDNTSEKRARHVESYRKWNLKEVPATSTHIFTASRQLSARRMKSAPHCSTRSKSPSPLTKRSSPKKCPFGAINGMTARSYIDARNNTALRAPVPICEEHYEVPPRAVKPVFRIQQQPALRVNQGGCLVIRAIVHRDSKGAEQAAPSHDGTVLILMSKEREQMRI